MDIAVQQHSQSSGELRKPILQVFQQSSTNDVTLPHLIKALDSSAADLIHKVLKSQMNNELSLALARQAKLLRKSRGRLAALKLIEKRTGKTIWKILTIFTKDRSNDVRAAIQNHLKSVPQNPLDKDLLKMVTDFAVQVLKSKERSANLQIEACENLSLYQGDNKLRPLKNFVLNEKVPDRARKVAIKTISDFPNTKALNILVGLERNKRLPLSFRKYAAQCLRSMTTGNGTPTWNRWLAKNKQVVSQQFKKVNRRREELLQDLQRRAQKFKSKQR